MAHAQRPTATPGGLEICLGFAVFIAAFIAAFQIGDWAGLVVGAVLIPGAFLLAIGFAHLRAALHR